MQPQVSGQRPTPSIWSTAVSVVARVLSEAMHCSCVALALSLVTNFLLSLLLVVVACCSCRQWRNSREVEDRVVGDDVPPAQDDKARRLKYCHYMGNEKWDQHFPPRAPNSCLWTFAPTWRNAFQARCGPIGWHIRGLVWPQARLASRSRWFSGLRASQFRSLMAWWGYLAPRPLRDNASQV